jgi:hypothetical protein
LDNLSKWFTVFAFAGIVWAGDPRAQFDRLKSEGQSAIKAEDWATAESRYRQLMQMAATIHPAVTEMYAEIVSPLAQVYKATGDIDKLEKLYQRRVDESAAGLERGLSQADLGFFYQSSNFASADRFNGERLVEDAVKTFEGCAANTSEGEQCRRRLADTTGIQGALFFQNLEYKRAEPLFRRVITTPDTAVSEEVMLVSLHALRGVLLMQKEFNEAKELEGRAAAFETAHPGALARLKQEGSKSPGR